MRVHEIIAEMAWPDKFDVIEQKIREENMTLDQLSDFLEAEYDIITVFMPGGMEPYAVSGGGVTDRRVDDELFDQMKDSGAPEELLDKVRGKFAMQLSIGPGIGPDTPVAQVRGLMHVLRHELSHIQQARYIPHDKHKRMSKKYITPKEDPISRVLYSIQPIESSQQATDYAAHLTRVGMTPEQFNRAINVVRDYLKGKTEIEGDELNDLVLSQIAKLSGKSERELLNQVQVKGYQMDISQLVSLIGALGMLRSIAMTPGVMSKSEKSKAKGQIRRFMKLLHRRYPKVKAYFKRHEDHEIESYLATADERAEMQRMAQELMVAFEALMGARGNG